MFIYIFFFRENDLGSACDEVATRNYGKILVASHLSGRKTHLTSEIKASDSNSLLFVTY